MPFRSRKPTATALPSLTAGEWAGVQSALRALHKATRADRGLASISRIVPRWRARPVDAAAPELRPLCEFLRENARHGPAVEHMAARLEDLGYSPAQIAALTLIAG